DLVVGEAGAALANFHQKSAREGRRAAKNDFPDRGARGSRAATLHGQRAGNSTVSNQGAIAADGETVGERVRAVANEIEDGSAGAVADEKGLAIGDGRRANFELTGIEREEALRAIGDQERVGRQRA